MFQKVDHVLPKGDQPIFSPSIPHNQKLTVICRLFFRKTYNFTSFVAILTIDARLKILRLWQLILVSRSRLRASGGQLPLRVLVSQIDCYRAQNWVGCPFFSILYEKMTALMPRFCQENVHSLKNTLLSCPYFSKKRPFPQKQGAILIHFVFKFLTKNPLLSCPYLVKKRQFCQN